MSKNARKATKQRLLQVFGTSEYTEASDPFPFEFDWKHLAQGKRRQGDRCAMYYALKDMPVVNNALVLTFYTYLQLTGSEEVFRYQNPIEMTEAIDDWDSEQESLEPGSFVLEPPKGARSTVYAAERRDKIKKGLLIPRKRGPNKNKRKPKVRFYRYE